MISLYNRLQTAWRKKLRSTKPAPDCGDGAEQIEQAQPNTLDYNRSYRLSDACRPRIRQFSLRVPAPLVPLYNRLQTIWRKIFPRTTRVAYSADWLSRTAMAGAISFSVAFIADASINGNGNLLAVAGSATARTVFSQSVALLGTLSDVI